MACVEIWRKGSTTRSFVRIVILQWSWAGPGTSRYWEGLGYLTTCSSTVLLFTNRLSTEVIVKYWVHWPTSYKLQACQADKHIIYDTEKKNFTPIEIQRIYTRIWWNVFVAKDCWYFSEILRNRNSNHCRKFVETFQLVVRKKETMINFTNFVVQIIALYQMCSANNSTILWFILDVAI
jgi:hypothetical protein